MYLKLTYIKTIKLNIWLIIKWFNWWKILTKEIPKNENPKKLTNTVEKILNFNGQQNGRGLKMLTSKKMLQRLPITFAQSKADNISGKLLNEICQIIYSFYREFNIYIYIQKYNEFNKIIKQSGYYIYEFWK